MRFYFKNLQILLIPLDDLFIFETVKALTLAMDIRDVSVVFILGCVASTGDGDMKENNWSSWVPSL